MSKEDILDALASWPAMDEYLEVRSASEIIADIKSALSAQQREPVVKHLDWVEREGVTGTFDASTSIGTFDASTSIGHYIATITDDDRGMWFIVGQTMANYMPPDIDAVRAAAQADYEARIKSALITAPPADAGMREALEIAHGKFCLIAGTEAWTDNCLDGWRRSPGALREYAEQAAKEIDTALTAPGATTKSDGGGETFITTGKVIGHFRPINFAPSDPSSTRSDPNEQAYADLIASGGIFPEAYQQGEASMTDDQIKHMVDRFLMWQLPENFNPDAGISYTRPNWPASLPGPVGTNLFGATQATAMVRHMLDGLPSSTRSEVTVRMLASVLLDCPAGSATAMARSLLEQFEIRRK